MKSDELFALLRRRGILWPSAEIYGGAQGLYDYGPLGTALKRRVEDSWSEWFLGLSDDYHLIEPAEILPEAVVRASGHLENFTDPEVRCGSCGAVFRADTVLEAIRPDGIDGYTPAQVAELIVEAKSRCPRCGAAALSVPQPFNLMFGLDFGAKAGERAYLRPETAQSSYLAFDRMYEVGRKALPLGVAVIGRAYRNEIAPRQVLFRMRAFTQAELQVFFDPAGFPVPFESVAPLALPVLRVGDRAPGVNEPKPLSAHELVADGLPEFYVYHLATALQYVTEVLRFPPSAIRLYEKAENERAFYNRIQFDIEVRVDSLGGYREIGAVHYRGDYDLTRHGQGSGKELSILTPRGERVVPHVLEITYGVDRILWALADRLIGSDGERTVWRLPPYLAPIAVGVFPLLRKEHASFAKSLLSRLRAEGLRAEYDEAGAIGRRYARMDEVGTPFCVTVDGETVSPGTERTGTVTLRDRDTKAQERLGIDALVARIRSSVRPPRPG